MEWREVALDKDRIPLSCNHVQYANLDAEGKLHIVTARDDDGHLVGYHFSILYPHIHYSTAGLMAFTDVYYLHPDFRRAGNGVLLFTEAERTLRDKGCIKAYISCKIDHDHTRLFQLLGWRLSDLCFIKMLD